MLNEISQDKYCIFYLHDIPRIGKFLEFGERKEGGVLLNGYRVSICSGGAGGGWKKFENSGDGYTVSRI